MKEFINKIIDPVNSLVLSVSINKARTGLLIECSEYLCYLHIQSKNAVALLNLLREAVDLKESAALVVEPQPLSKAGFKMLQDATISGSWTMEGSGRYLFASEEEDEEEWFSTSPKLEKKETKK